MEFRAASEQDIFKEELRILSAAKSDLALGKTSKQQYEQLIQHYEKLLKTTIKLSRISDIQGKMLKEQELALTTAHADLQNHEQLRRQLISDISHELRTPITSVQGYVKAFMDQVIPPDADYLSMIYQKLLTMNQLISDLFQLSTLRANQLTLHFKHVPVFQWYAAIDGKYELEAKRHGVHLVVDSKIRIEHSLDLVPESAVMFIDTLRIDQVITNLLDNALKYTRQGGSVRISGQISKYRSNEAAAVGTNSSNRPPFWFTLFVEDTGEGIRDSDLPFIFERFYRAPDTHTTAISGSGLGLAISKELINQHEGQIGVDSEFGRGSRFHFSVPVYNISRPRPTSL